MLQCVTILIVLTIGGFVNTQICDDNAKNKLNCGWLNMTEQDCHNYNCCWAESGMFTCYHKIFLPPVYKVDSKVSTANGLVLELKTEDITPSKYGTAITPIRVEAIMETADRLRVKIYDPNNPRWEIPTNIVPSPDPPTNKPQETNYNIETSELGEEFWFAVLRGDSEEVLFNSSVGNSLQFYDQYLEIGTQLPKGFNLYGLGEQVRGFRINESDQYTLWDFDIPTPYHKNLYGSHPFYLEHRVDTGKSHGVFLRNSNGMDINTTQCSVTYHIIGGILDFYFFMGPSSEQVISQYLDVIGRPALPPYWSLGFHQCRWGYKDVQALEEVVANYSKANIPLETIWSDIDYMDKYKDFTFDPNNFPVEKMRTFVNRLHTNNQYYVVIVDPGIATEKDYSPYVKGLAKGVFIKDHTGDVFTGKVWPGITAYPDFFNPDTQNWWEELISEFLDQVEIDGIWIDMNEVSNFCNGECTQNEDTTTEFKLSLDSNDKHTVSSDGIVEFGPNNPPYSINNQNQNFPLNTKTLDMDACHFGNVLVYNAHNLYGLTESIATHNALVSYRQNQRPFILSRSTFPGSGRYTAHWTGDNHATWEDLYLSIPDMLNFQLFGIPMVGSDICGFNGETTEELCGRWMALGSFYPFSRNHNIKTSHVPQEAYIWESVASISRETLSIRYSLLPYLYTQFALTHKGSEFEGNHISTVVKPLFFQFPMDEYSLFVDKQFLFGPALMVSQVLQSNVDQLTVYFPPGKWYDWFTHSVIESTETGVNKTLPTPKDKIQLHILGGHILTTQSPAMTTSECRKGAYSLIVALDKENNAEGRLYLDDGVTLDTKSYVYIQYSAEEIDSGGVTITASPSKGPAIEPNFYIPHITTVYILGLSKSPSKVELNGQTVRADQYTFSDGTLVIKELTVTMEEKWSIKVNY